MLESQIQLGLTYYSIGRTPDAIREWDAVLEKDPSRDEARMYLRLVRGPGRSPAVQSPVDPSPGFDATEDLSFASIDANEEMGNSSPSLAGTPGWSKTALAKAGSDSDPEDSIE